MVDANISSKSRTVLGWGWGVYLVELRLASTIVLPGPRVVAGVVDDKNLRSKS